MAPSIPWQWCRPQIYDTVVLVLCLVNKCRISNAAFDIGGGLGPAKGLGVVVPMTEPVHNCSLETTDAVKAAAANSLAGNYCEPAFNQVQPRRAARCEVQMDRGMGAKQFVHRGMFVGSVVVADEMQFAL